MSKSIESKQKYVIAQTYVKDISFENPFFLELMKQTQEGKPDVKFNLEIKVNQGDADHYEVVLIVKVDVMADNKAYIQSEITYAALAKLAEDVDKGEVLFVDIPHQIYPEIRPLISQHFWMANTVSTFKIPVVDFKSLYAKRLQEKDAEESSSNTKAH